MLEIYKIIPLNFEHTNYTHITFINTSQTTTKMQSKLTLLAVLGFFISGNLFAQTSVSSNEFTPKAAIAGSSETFYEDAENKLLYIDFETVNVNLSDIKVKNADGEIVLEDELWSLPVNTIYEVDYKEFAAGTYEIELRSFTGVLRKTVEVK